MPRRLTLSPLPRGILILLEEAGAETVGTVVATLKPSLDEFTSQIDQLAELGPIRKDSNSLILTDRGGSL